MVGLIWERLSEPGFSLVEVFEAFDSMRLSLQSLLNYLNMKHDLGNTLAHNEWTFFLACFQCNFKSCLFPAFFKF